MLRRMSQLRLGEGGWGRRSLITSKISLIAYSIAHFLSSSVPNFFTSAFAPFPGLKKKTTTLRRESSTARLRPSDCIFFIRKQGQRRENQRERDARKVGPSEESGAGTGAARGRLAEASR